MRPCRLGLLAAGAAEIEMLEALEVDCYAAVPRAAKAAAEKLRSVPEVR